MGGYEDLEQLRRRVADLARDLEGARALLRNVERHLQDAMKQLELILASQDG